MDFRKETRGENPTKAVDLVVSIYDTGKVQKEGKVVGEYAEVHGHPDAQISQDQTNLALVNYSEKYQGKSVSKHAVPFAVKQIESIKEVAGDNQAPLLDSDGNRVGTTYGIKADLMTASRKDQIIGMMPNTKTLQASELSVAEVDGKDIRSRIFESMRATKEAQKAAKQAESPEVSAEVEAERPAVEDELELA